MNERMKEFFSVKIDSNGCGTKRTIYDDHSHRTQDTLTRKKQSATSKNEKDRLLLTELTSTYKYTCDLLFCHALLCSFS